MNRPIDRIDLDGEEWKSVNSWSQKITDKKHIQIIGSSYVKGMTYEQAWQLMAPKLLEAKKGKPYDCADVSIATLVEFSYMFRLPIYFKDNKAKDTDPTFDNDNYGYKDKDGRFKSFKEGDWKSLADAIGKKYYGAADLYNNDNLTTDKKFSDLKPGDLVGFKYSNLHYHSQTVSEVGDSWFLDYDDINDYYKTYQGNLHQGKAVPVYDQEYDINTVKNAKRNHKFDYDNAKVTGTKVKKWNTKNFDSHK